MRRPGEHPAAGPVAAAPAAVFFGLLALGVLAGCAGYAALVLHTARWPAVAALRTFYPRWHPRAYTEAEFEYLRAGLGGSAVGLLLLAVGLAGRAAGRAELVALGGELRGAWRGLGAGWRALRPGQRRLAGWGLLALTGLRAYYSVATQPYDDAVSYEVFVRARLLALSACYPMPNNHVLTNTLAWVFYQAYPGFWWSMRLPVLLVSTVGTVAWFGGLLRWSTFRVALLAVGWFGTLQLSLYHATSGRGYALLVLLGAVGFFSTLVLAEASADQPGRRPTSAGYQRAAWLGLTLAGALGLYAVPTFGYLLASAYGWLGLRALINLNRAGWKNARHLLLPALGAGLLTLVGAASLYAPLLLISGPALFFHNEYVTALPAGEFWRQLPVYLWQSEGWLTGERRVGALGTLLVVGGALVLRRQARQLPPALAGPVRRLVGPALWFMTVPYALVLVQGVPAPERTLYYKAQFLFVLAALGADGGLRRLGPVGRVRSRRLLLAGSLLFAASQVVLLERYNSVRRAAWGPAHAGLAWLATQPPGPVLAPRPVHRFLLRFYAHSQYRERPWQIDYFPRPGVRYRYVVGWAQDRQVPGAPPLAAPPAFHNAEMNIFALW